MPKHINPNQPTGHPRLVFAITAMVVAVSLVLGAIPDLTFWPQLALNAYIALLGALLKKVTDHLLK